MKHERATEEIRELAALYALGSLTQHEARSFETHLQEGCPVCEAELRRFERTAAGIGFAAEEVETPEYLRDLLLARIEREPQAAASLAAPGGKSRAESPNRTPSPAPGQPAFFQTGGESRSILPWVLIVILAVLAIVTGFAWRSAKKTNDQLLAKMATARGEDEDLRILYDIQKAKADNLEQIFALVSKPQSRIARLAGQAAAPSLSGVVFCDTTQNDCFLIGTFPPASPGKAYQLWFTTPMTSLPAGLIKTDPAGRAFDKVQLPAGFTNAAEVRITLEPDRGSQTPTLPYLAAGRFN